MIVPESPRDEYKTSTIGDDGSVAVSSEPSNPPPYTSNSSAAPSSSTTSATPLPSCNYLLDHKSNGTLKGTWHLDTSLRIPESLLPPITDFDGRWNEDIKKARKRKTPFPWEVRPNLMIMSEHGAVRADVHVAPNDGGPALIVAESKYGSVHLTLDVSPKQVSRVHAMASNGEVKVWVPSTFDGALTIGTSYGNIKISDGIKAKMTTFYSKSNRSRSFIGDWQSAGFGTTAPTPSQPTYDSKSPVVDDPFTTWPGSTIRIDSTHSSVSLAFIEEKQAESSCSDRPGPLSTILGGLFGWGSSAKDEGAAPQPQQPGSSTEPAPDVWPLDRKVLPPRPSEN